jgi:hypothetical protein
VRTQAEVEVGVDEILPHRTKGTRPPARMSHRVSSRGQRLCTMSRGTRK